MDVTENTQKTTRKYTKKKENRKPRSDRGVIKNNNYNISGFLEHNPNATTDDIIKYRSEYRKKYIVIHRFCIKHPEYKQEEILKDMPYDSIDSLKKFRPLYWVRDKEKGDSSSDDMGDCLSGKCSCYDNYDNQEIFDECQNLKAKRRYLREQVKILKGKMVTLKN